MRTILVLGATSPIGAALSEQFSNGNRIILSGRNCDRLTAIAGNCRSANALEVRIAAADLAQSIQPIIDANSEWPIELIVDAASAASRARDLDVAPDAMRGIVQADILAHLDIFQELARLNGKHPDVVLISTVLAIVKTPEREIYSAAKRLLELYLEKIAANKSQTRVMLFRVGKLIDSIHDNQQARLLAQRVHRELSAGKTIVLYGMSGKILLGLNSLHPIVLDVLIRVQRALRGNLWGQSR